MRGRDLAEAWIDDLTQRLHETSHPELATIIPRIAASLETLRPMVLDPDPSDGRRLAIGMARTTQAALLAFGVLDGVAPV
jgi:hypothetical protein